MKNKILLLLLLIAPVRLFALCGQGGDGQCTALTGKFVDVNNAVNGGGGLAKAIDGDVITIPAGQWKWGRDANGNPDAQVNGLVINAAITLQGATKITQIRPTNPLSQTGPPVDDAAGTWIIRDFNTKKPMVTINSVGTGCRPGYDPGCSVDNSKMTRITGITFGSNGIFQGAQPNPLYLPAGVYFQLSGNSWKVRIDHCHFDLRTYPPEGKMFFVADSCYGVFDHNVIETGTVDKNGGGKSMGQIFDMHNGTRDRTGVADTVGNWGWERPTNWGSNEFFYIEDCYVRQLPAPLPGATPYPSGATTSPDLTDGGGGSKWVVRHCYLYDVDVQTHGTEGTGRGVRAALYYGNEFHQFNPGITVGGSRCASILFFNNKIYGLSSDKRFQLAVYRISLSWSNQQGENGWQGASGRCPWDINETNGAAISSDPYSGVYSGNGMDPVPAYRYWPNPGVHTVPPQPSPATTVVPCSVQPTGNMKPPLANCSDVNTSSANRVVPSPTANPAWSPNQFQNFGMFSASDATAYNLDPAINPSAGYSNLIGSHTNASITALDTSFGSSRYMLWAYGGSFQIFKCLIALDQPGRGGGLDKLAGTSVNSITQGGWYNERTKVGSSPGIRLWPRQVMDPCYAWDNPMFSIGGAATGAQFVFGMQTPGTTILNDREFYNMASPSPSPGGTRQTTGVSSGAFANRPTSGKGGHDVANMAETANGATKDAKAPGTAYWANDAPSANQSSETGALYVYSPFYGWDTPAAGNAAGPYFQPYTYPHPCTNNPDCTLTPTAPNNLNPASASTTAGQDANVTVTVQGYPLPSLSPTPGPGPVPTWATFSGGASGTGSITIHGTPPPTPTQYNFSFKAVNLAPSGTQVFPFTLNIAAAAATPSVTMTAAPSGNVLTTDDVTMTATASAASGRTIASVQFYDSATALGTPIPGPAASYVRTQKFAQGSHSLTAKSTDDIGSTSAASTPAISVTASNPGATPGPPTPTSGQGVVGTAITPIVVTSSGSPAPNVVPTPNPGATPPTAQFTFNSATAGQCTITGTPTGTPAVYNFSFKATNTGGSNTSNFTLTITATPTPTPIPLKPGPVGMYLFPNGFISASNPATTSAGPTPSSVVYQNANCDGVRWLVKWADVEQTPGVYTWGPLDDAVAYAAAAPGKKCGISIDAGVFSPPWLFDATLPTPAASFTLTQGNFLGKIPVPNDPVFMQRWQQFVKDMGARYNNNPTVSFVFVSGIGNHDEWEVASGATDTTGIGGTTAQVGAWKSGSKAIIDFTMAAFPSTTVLGYPVPPFNAATAAEDPVTSMKAVSDYAGTTYFAQASPSPVPNQRSSFAYGVAPLTSSVTTSNNVAANEVFNHWKTNQTHGETWNPAPLTPAGAADFNATLQVALGLKIRCMEIYRRDFERTDNNMQTYINDRRADMLAIPAAPFTAATPTPAPIIITP